MTVINSTVDNLIRNIKDTGSVDDIRFVRAYNASEKQKPLSGLCAVVSLTEVGPRTRFISGLAPNGLHGEVYSASLILRLYSSGTGEQLTDAALRLSDAVKTADVGRLVNDVKIKSICFDKDCCEVYRDVCAGLGFLLCEDSDE